MTALAFAAGYVTCAISVALLIGAVVRVADKQAHTEPAPVAAPLYVPQEWFA